MATITTNTQLKLISQLSDIGNIGGDDLILVQRGLKSYKSNYSNFINGLPDNSTIEVNGGKLSVKSTVGNIADGSIGIQKLGQLSENTVIGNLAGGDNPEEISIVTDLDQGSENNIANSTAIKNYVNGRINTISAPDNENIAGSYTLKDYIYTNSNNRRIMVMAILDGDNDIYGFAAHVAENSSDLSGKGGGRDVNGRDASTCKAYEYHVSDGGAADATTLIFMVPDGWHWLITGDASVIRCEVWEI